MSSGDKVSPGTNSKGFKTMLYIRIKQIFSETMMSLYSIFLAWVAGTINSPAGSIFVWFPHMAFEPKPKQKSDKKPQIICAYMHT